MDVSTNVKKRRRGAEEDEVLRSFASPSTTTSPLPRITFVAPNRTFERLFKETSLSTMKESVRTKLGLAPGASIELAQLRGERRIDLEDEDDFDALKAYAWLFSAVEIQIRVLDTGASDMTGLHAQPRAETQHIDLPSAKQPSEKVKKPSPRKKAVDPTSEPSMTKKSKAKASKEDTWAGIATRSVAQGAAEVQAKDVKAAADSQTKPKKNRRKSKVVAPTGDEQAESPVQAEDVPHETGPSLGIQHATEASERPGLAGEGSGKDTGLPERKQVSLAAGKSAQKLKAASTKSKKNAIPSHTDDAPQTTENISSVAEDTQAPTAPANSAKKGATLQGKRQILETENEKSENVQTPAPRKRRKVATAEAVVSDAQASPEKDNPAPLATQVADAITHAGKSTTKKAKASKKRVTAEVSQAHAEEMDKALDNILGTILARARERTIGRTYPEILPSPGNAPVSHAAPKASMAKAPGQAQTDAKKKREKKGKDVKSARPEIVEPPAREVDDSEQRDTTALEPSATIAQADESAKKKVPPLVQRQRTRPIVPSGSKISEVLIESRDEGSSSESESASDANSSSDSEAEDGEKTSESPVRPAGVENKSAVMPTPEVLLPSSPGPANVTLDDLLKPKNPLSWRDIPSSSEADSDSDEKALSDSGEEEEEREMNYRHDLTGRMTASSASEEESDDGYDEAARNVSSLPADHVSDSEDSDGIESFATRSSVPSIEDISHSTKGDVKPVPPCAAEASPAHDMSSDGSSQSSRLPLLKDVNARCESVTTEHLAERALKDAMQEDHTTFLSRLDGAIQSAERHDKTEVDELSEIQKKKESFESGVTPGVSHRTSADDLNMVETMLAEDEIQAEDTRARPSDVAGPENGAEAPPPPPPPLLPPVDIGLPDEAKARSPRKIVSRMKDRLGKPISDSAPKMDETSVSNHRRIDSGTSIVDVTTELQDQASRHQSPCADKSDSFSIMIAKPAPGKQNGRKAPRSLQPTKTWAKSVSQGAEGVVEGPLLSRATQPSSSADAKGPHAQKRASMSAKNERANGIATQPLSTRGAERIRDVRRMTVSESEEEQQDHIVIPKKSTALSGSRPSIKEIANRSDLFTPTTTPSSSFSLGAAISIVGKASLARASNGVEDRNEDEDEDDSTSDSDSSSSEQSHFPKGKRAGSGLSKRRRKSIYATLTGR